MIIALTILAILLIGVIAVLAGAFLSLHRRHHPRYRLPERVDVESDLPSLAGLTHADVADGNRIELVQNGAYVDAFAQLARNAQHTLHFETFLWRSGRMSEQIVGMLAQAAHRGVTVRVLVDAVGGRAMNKHDRSTLRQAGVTLHLLRPIGWRHLGWANNRTHRKILVADGLHAMVGGHCIDDRWLGDARNRNEFRDVSVLVDGPVVRQIQAAFCENWIEVCGIVPYGETIFPELSPCGPARAHLAYVRPSGGVSAVRLLHHLALRVARKRLWIQTPYFLPNRDARSALVEAVRRGVDVRVLTPSIDASDNRLVQHASHRRLAPLLERGIRIYYYHRTLAHQKVWTVDGSYALIGSTNFDERSFDLDDQVTLAVSDPALVEEIDARFVADLAHAVPVSSKEWKARPRHEKARDALAYMLRDNL